MSLPTCAVLCSVYDDSGDPVTGAVISAKLNQFEVYEGYVVPQTIEATTDTNGEATLNLWPNQLGSTSSMYEVKISSPNGKRLRVNAIVPNVSNTELHLIAELPPYDGKTDGQLILDAAIAAGATAISKAAEASASATAAATSATSAANSASNITSAVNTAVAAASTATQEAELAVVSATTATNKASAASSSATSAENSATSAASSATTATTKASEASTSATNAASSATSSASSAATATTKATEAANSASTATTASSSASTSASNAATSASTASTKANEASASASAASTSATNAASSSASASASALSATGSATTATTKASEASTSATNAASSASTATTKATEASTSATTATTKASEASTSATAAASAKTAAEAARDSALSAFANFNDQYLGVKASDPTTDNTGGPLAAGNLYYNSSPLNAGGGMKVYDGTVWLVAYASLSGALLSANNLSDLANVTSARTNIGLGNVENKSSSTIRSEITSSNVTTALGFTPYADTNPSGFITASALSGYLTSASASSTYLSLAGGTLTGDLMLSGTGRRITGDFTNGTNNNRLMVQTSTTNGLTSFGLLPNGTSAQSSFEVYGASDTTNTAFGRLLINSTQVSIRSAINGTGTYLPFTVWTGGSERFRVNETTGNFLLGTTTDDGTHKLQVSGDISATSFVGAGTGLTGTAASLSIGGSAGSVAWGNVSGRPTAVSSFTNDSGYITSAALAGYESTSNKGASNGYAPLGSDTKIAAIYLPSYVDDVVEGANLAAFTATGETGKIYVALDTNKTYRWSGSAYIEISASPGSTDAVTEGSVNLYFTNARAQSALAGMYLPIGGGTLTGDMTLSGTAKLGIGTNNPAYKLDVSGVARIGNNVTPVSPSSTDILSTAHTILSGYGGNYLTFGQYGNFSQWIQSSYLNPTTATYNLILQPLGGRVLVGLTTAPTSSVGQAVTYGVQVHSPSGGGFANVAVAGGGQYFYTYTGAMGAESYAERMRIDTAGNIIVQAGSIQEHKSSLSANNIDLSTGNYFNKTISGATTLTVSNVPATNTVGAFILELTNGGSGTITWWSGVKWAGGTAPTLTSAGVDIIAFYTHDGGTTWRGAVIAKDSK